VVWIVMREALILIATGLVIGLPAAWALTRLVRAQLYGIDPGDPVSIALATMLLASVTVMAGFVPARRAASFDPWRILRHD
jgi:ABC-type antimicrobial peptide transport system permease subunit